MNSKKLPKKVTIFGHKFKVEITELVGYHGTSDDDDKTIQINNKLSYEQQQAVLFHECLHMCLCLAGHSYRGGDHTEEYEEMLVRCIENGMAHLIRIDA